MIDFCKRQATTKQGQIKISVLFSVLFICFAVIGMTVFTQPYAVYATGEKVADPWVVSVDGSPVVVVDSEAAGEAVETGLRMHYAGSQFEAQQDIKMLNEITVTKYDFDNTKTHPVVMNTQEAVDYIVGMNETAAEPVVAFETQRLVRAEEAIPYQTVETEDADMEQGDSAVTTEGKNGSKEVTTQQTLINGKVVSETVVEETVLSEPVNEVVAVGTKQPEGTGHGVNGSGMAAAYSMIGVPYVYGGVSYSGVDCSGLVNVCYGGARGRTTYAMIGSLQATGDWKTSMSELNPGDLVFPSAGHVGIYVGDGMMIHAPSPGRSVCLAPVYSFIGGGAY